jgi:hypothetical protein
MLTDEEVEDQSSESYLESLVPRGHVTRWSTFLIVTTGVAILQPSRLSPTAKGDPG